MSIQSFLNKMFSKNKRLPEGSNIRENVVSINQDSEKIENSNQEPKQQENNNQINEKKESKVVEPVVRIYSKANKKLEEGKNILEYTFTLDVKDEKGQDGKRIIGKATNIASTEKLKDAKFQIEDLIKQLEINKFDMIAIDNLRDQMDLKLRSIAKETNIQFREDFKSTIEEYVYREEIEAISNQQKDIKEKLNIKKIPYKAMEETLPRKIDVKEVSPEIIVKTGRKLKERLSELEKISSKEDINEESRAGITDYMKEREEKNDIESAIVTASVKNMCKLNKLDCYTIIQCMKEMEKTSTNEDSKLYSIYLKIEEKRIIDRIQDVLLNLPENNEVLDYAAYLESIKMDDVDPKDLRELFSAYSKEEKDGSIQNYLNSYRKIDIGMIKYFNTNEDAKNVPDKNKILQYLYGRVASLGQVAPVDEKVNKNDKILSLREVIENTDYKNDKQEESNAFLYYVSQVEKSYIETRYEDIIKEYENIQSKEDKTSNYFKDSLKTQVEVTPNDNKENKDKDNNEILR